MSLEQFLSAIFQVSTGVVLSVWAIVGVIVSTYYAYKVGHNLITRRARIVGKLKKSKLFSLYDRGGKPAEVRKLTAKSK